MSIDHAKKSVGFGREKLGTAKDIAEVNQKQLDELLDPNQIVHDIGSLAARLTNTRARTYGGLAFMMVATEHMQEAGRRAEALFGAVVGQYGEDSDNPHAQPILAASQGVQAHAATAHSETVAMDFYLTQAVTALGAAGKAIENYARRREASSAANAAAAEQAAAGEQHADEYLQTMDRAA